MKKFTYISILLTTLGQIVLGTLAGLFLGSAALGAVATLLILLLWNLYNLIQLEQSLASGKDLSSIDTFGIWSQIYSHLHRIRKRRRKRAQQLSGTLGQFRQAAMAIPDAFVLLGADGTVAWANQSAIDLFGLSMPQDIGQPITHLVRHPVFVAHIMDNEPAEESPIFPSPMDPQRFLRVRVMPYGEEGQLVLIGNEVTRVLHLEGMRRDFITNVTHELSTPLTVIIGYMEMLNNEEIPDHLQIPLSGVNSQFSKIRAIMKNLLSLSRLQTSSIEHAKVELNIAEIISEIVSQARELSGERGHILSSQLDPDLKLWGRKSEIIEIFSQLIFNAIEHTPDRSLIAIRWREENGHPVFSVKDNGKGVADYHLPRLTERFYKAGPNQLGAGLGLTIVKYTLLRQGGELHIRSELGKGSYFSCVFNI